MFCPYCGVEIPDGSSFCGFCGKKIAAVESTETIENSTIPKSAESENASVSESVPELVGGAESENSVLPKSAESENASASGSAPETVGGAESGNSVIPETAKSEKISDQSIVTDDAAIVKGRARRAFDITALFRNKLFLICTAAVLVFIILIIIAVYSMSAGMDKNPLKGFYYPVTADGETVFFYNGEKISGTDFSAGLGISALSIDGTVALVIDNDELFMLNKGKITSIADDLTGSGFALSENGNTAVYIADDELCVYSGGEKNKICDVDASYTAYFAVSPDGGSVVYKVQGEDLSNSVCVWGGGKTYDLDAKFDPLFVSNGAKIVYGRNSLGDLVYVKDLKPDSDEKIKNFNYVIDITGDHSGVLFLANSATYYFDASLSEPIKVTSRVINVINEGSYPIVRKNFKEFYAASSSGIYKFTKKKGDFDSDKLISGVNSVMLSEDGKTFVYSDGDELVKVSAADPDNERVIDDEVFSFQCDPSAKHIYYLDDDGDLRYASSKKRKICSDVDKFFVNYDGVCVFSNIDGDLYYSSKGGDKKKVSGISDVSMISMINGVCYVTADDTLYVSKDGKRFEKTGVDF